MTNYYHERRDYLNGEGKNHRIHRQNREPTTYSIDGGGGCIRHAGLLFGGG